jgi:hypothetical protein
MLKLTLTGDELRGMTLRFENAGTSPVAVIRSYRPGFYASYDVAVIDASGRRLRENADVMCCGTPYPLTADALIVLPPGGAQEVAVDTLGYALEPGRYRVSLTYRTNRSWLERVVEKPAGFEHLAEGEWTSNEVLTI